MIARGVVYEFTKKKAILKEGKVTLNIHLTLSVAPWDKYSKRFVELDDLNCKRAA